MAASPVAKPPPVLIDHPVWRTRLGGQARATHFKKLFGLSARVRVFHGEGRCAGGRRGVHGGRGIALHAVC